MNCRLRMITVLVALAPAFAHADAAVFVEGGTLGAGAGVGFRLTDAVTLRLGYSGLNYSPGNIDAGDLTYDAKLDIRAGKALVDWHPFHGGFHLSAGLFYNGNKLSVDAKPAAATYTINNVQYQSSDIGRLDGRVDFNSAAPYLGAGWGNVVGGGGHLRVAFDLGVMFQGSANVDLQATCGPALSSGQCTILQNDVAAEEKNLKDKVNDYRYYPVANLAVSWRF